jgi:hypothetical protein
MTLGDATQNRNISSLRLLLTLAIIFHDNEECHAAKGKQTCSCLEAQLKFVNFFIYQQKKSQHIVFNLVFNEDSKMGSAIFVPFAFQKLL